MVVSARNVGGTGIVSTSDDVLGMSVVRWMRGVSGMCEMCLARGGVGEWGEWRRGLGLALPFLWEQGECLTCVCVWVALVYVGSG